MVEPLAYKLSSRPRINWSDSQIKSINRDYPFDFGSANETEEQYVVRTYLQFLWLPESIMPLAFLVSSMSRVTGTTPTEAHPLHEQLKPLLQTTKSIANKYNIELPSILRDGGGAGEIEETMMWYALNHEKADDDLWEKTTDGPWEDESWRKKWIERMERREVLVQILLHFLKLSLPGPQPDPSPKKRKKSKASEKSRLEEEANLESLFDRLSMWQLMIDVEQTRGPKPTEKQEQEQDWMQRFYSDVISPQFQTKLPDLCALFHSKIFPTSYFSSSEPSSPSTSRATSPDIAEPPAKEPTRKNSTRQVSPALSTTSNTSSRHPHRARSLSVSLAEERALQRELSIGPSAPKKRVLNREVSMSRGFKPKPKPNASNAENTNATRTDAKKQSKQDAPVKKERDLGVTLVEATPVKARPARTQSQSQTQMSLKDVFSRQRSVARVESVSSVLSSRSEGFGDEEEWQLASSPGLVSVFGDGEEGELTDIDEDADEGAGSILVDSTPTKRKRVR